MLYDDLNPPVPGAPEPGFVPRSGGSRRDENRPDDRPVADREVPLPAGHTTMVAIHQWLDGEITAATVRATANGNDAVDLWTKINDEAELLRSRTTPLYVHKRIMESLPDDTHRLHKAWYQRSVALTPVAILAAAAALVGIGALIARLAAR